MNELKPWHWIVAAGIVAAIAYAWGTYSVPGVTISIGEPVALGPVGPLSTEITGDSNLALPGEPGFVDGGGVVN